MALDHPPRILVSNTQKSSARPQAEQRVCIDSHGSGQSERSNQLLPPSLAQTSHFDATLDSDGAANGVVACL